MARRPPRPGRNGGNGHGADGGTGGNGGDRHGRPGRLALLGRGGQNRGIRHNGNGRNGHTDDASDPQRLIPVRPNMQVAARVGLWGLVALGAIGGLVGLLRPAAEPATQGTGASESATVPPEMAGFAELAVRTWIEASGDEDDAAVAALFAVNPSTAAGDSGRRRVGATETVGARRVSDNGSGHVDNVENVDDYWAVTVAAGVDEFGTDRRWRSAGMWYVEIGVVKDDHGALVAVGEPALVPAPAEPAEDPRPAGGGLGVPSGNDEEMASTVEGFLSALVAGDGDVSRYVAPGVEIAPVTPAPFQEIALQRWSVTELSDTEVRIRLTARGTSAGGVPRTVSYELGLKQRAGRWEVRSLSGAPTLDDDSGGGPAESTTTTEPSTTTVSISSSPGA